MTILFTLKLHSVILNSWVIRGAFFLVHISINGIYHTNILTLSEISRVIIDLCRYEWNKAIESGTDMTNSCHKHLKFGAYSWVIKSHTFINKLHRQRFRCFINFFQGVLYQKVIHTVVRSSILIENVKSKSTLQWTWKRTTEICAQIEWLSSNFTDSWEV